MHKILSTSCINFQNVEYYDEHLRKLDIHCGCSEIKPYLSDVDVRDQQVLEMFEAQEASGKGEGLKLDPVEPDYTLEKFLFYDDFLKSLEVLAVIYSCCLKCQELMGVGISWELLTADDKLLLIPNYFRQKAMVTITKYLD